MMTDSLSSSPTNRMKQARVNWAHWWHEHDPQAAGGFTGAEERIARMLAEIYGVPPDAATIDGAPAWVKHVGIARRIMAADPPPRYRPMPADAIAWLARHVADAPPGWFAWETWLADVLIPALDRLRPRKGP